MITPFRKPTHRDLLDWEEQFNTQINKIRYVACGAGLRPLPRQSRPSSPKLRQRSRVVTLPAKGTNADRSKASVNRPHDPVCTSG
jgi:hypothetical protein